MEKFIVTVPRYQQESEPHIRISQEAYAVLAAMCGKTGWPMSKLASKAVLFAAEHLSVEAAEENKEG